MKDIKLFVQIYSSSGKQLMQKIADLVPRHPERKVKKQELQATTLTAGTSSKSGKGGKKKR
ncbi:BnaAnng40050D [Brassica napus]|uniref:BnaAnng40050D protein n=1 Tax=Brassica napus TaxID=3708 RepID=A0A078K2L5_BRANA|nr:BnaAnng40050D [Brassica napus]